MKSPAMLRECLIILRFNYRMMKLASKTSNVYAKRCCCCSETLNRILGVISAVGVVIVSKLRAINICIGKRSLAGGR